MKMTIQEFIETMRVDYGPTGEIKLTQTMLEKHIIDANKTVIQLAQSIGVDYAKLEKGEKITIAGRFDCDGKACNVSFYRTKARGDKRFSVSGLKRRAQAGQTIAIAHDANGALVVNVSQALQEKSANKSLKGQSVPALAAMLKF